jgi:hypothetical protein
VTTGRKYVFDPIAYVTPREDGRMTVEFDWESSHRHTLENGEMVAATDDELDEVTDALDLWLESQPSVFLIGGPEKPGPARLTDDVGGLINDLLEGKPVTGVYPDGTKEAALSWLGFHARRDGLI